MPYQNAFPICTYEIAPAAFINCWLIFLSLPTIFMTNQKALTLVLNTIYKSVLLSVCISQPHFWWKDEGLGEHFREGSCRSSGFSSQKKHKYIHTKARLEFGLLISNWWSCSNVVIHSQHFLQGSLLGINQLGRRGAGNKEILSLFCIRREG